MNVALHTDSMKSRIKAEESADWLLPFIGDKKRVTEYCYSVSVTSSNKKNWLFTVHVPLYCTGKTLQNNVLVFILCASENGTVTEFAPSAKTV